jgi:hypothetical protein
MSDQVTELLSKFPGPVTLKASWRKWARMLLIGMGFVVLSVLLVQSDAAPSYLDKLVGWTGIVVFGAGTVLSAANIFSGAGKLMLHDAGFEVTSFFRSRGALWRDAAGFQVFSPWYMAKRSACVVYDDANEKRNSLWQMTLAQWYASLVGRNAGLPDTYGLSADELANLMNQWRERALK